MKAAKYLPAVTAVVFALVSTSSFADRADFGFRIGDGSFAIDIRTPPAPVVEYVSVALPGPVWVPGYWAWNGHRQVWNSGVWERPRPGYRHESGHWEQRDGRRYFAPPQWEAHRTVERRGEMRDYVRHVRYEDDRDQAFFRDRGTRRQYSR